MRINRRRIAFAFAFTLLAGSACGSDGDSSTPLPSSIPASTPTSSGSAPETTAAGRARVVVDDAGSQPRQILALHVAAGEHSRVALVSRLGLEMTIDGDELPGSTVVPGTRTVLDQRVDKVDPDGTVHYSATFAEVSVVDTPGADPDVVSQTEDALRELEGLHGTGTVDPQGGQTLVFDTSTLRDSNLKATIDSVSSQVGNLSAPLPSEPVGRGARWTVSASATINGITMNTTTHYSLRSRDGDQYVIDLTQEASAPPGPAAFPGLPIGTRASITSFELQSSGKVTGDLTRQLPLTSTVAGTGDGEFVITTGADEATLEEHLIINFSMTPA